MTPRLALFARAILTRHRAQPLENAFVLVQGHRILQVGQRKDLQFLPSVRVLDLGDTILLPGLINAHCHLDFTSLQGKVPLRDGFRDWLTRIALKTRGTTPADFKRSIAEGIRQSLDHGTTTLYDISTSYESYELLKKSGLRSAVFFEALDFGQPLPLAVWKRLLERVKRATAFPPHPTTLRWGFSPHTPYTVSRELFHLVGRQLAHHRKMPTAIHVGESRSEWELFQKGRGALAKRRSELNPDWAKPHAKTPVQFLSKLGWLPKLDLAVHCNTVDGKDLELLAKHRIGVVHCPGSHAFFGHPKFRYAEFKKRGIPVALGTDSLASNRSLSMFREMRLFAQANPTVRPSEVLSLATDRAAEALGEGKSLGQVRPGYLADLIGVPAPSHLPRDPEELAEWVIHHQGPVSFSMVNGERLLRVTEGSRA